MAIRSHLVDLYDNIQGYQVTQTIYSVVRLGVLEVIGEKLIHYEKISEVLGINSNLIYRILRAVTSIGIVHEIETNLFSITEKGRFLLKDTEGSLYEFTLRSGEESYMAWSKLYDGLQKNIAPFQLQYGENYFSYLKENKRMAELFHNSMVAHSTHDIHTILNNYNFLEYKSIVDIGGGKGCLLQAILERNVTAKGVLFEHEESVLKLDLKTDRINIVKGDFFEVLPSGGALYILKFILHDWNDTDAIKLLKTCRKAISEHGKLLIIEAILPTTNTPDSITWHDLHMFTLFNSKERTENEYKILLEKANFKLSSLKKTDRSGLVQLHLMEAAPA